MKRKFLAMILTLTLLAGIPLPALAEEAVQPAEAAEETASVQTVTIRDLDAFLAFAENCALDSWSQGKHFVLGADINLEGVAFDPIPTFGGSFDGAGHSITGLNITRSLSPAGLFGMIQADAVVKNLTVQGIVAPAADGTSVGGLAGENSGTVENCTFYGTVSGDLNTGGIAGSNFGILRGCSTDGHLTGRNRTGGIAGYSTGTIQRCRSAMSVNTESVDPTIDPTQIELRFTMDLSKVSDLDVSSAASDTGGIAGYSSGTIADCVNTGTVGYPHIGYNLGGIVGRSCGFVKNCENRGSLMGRKDVGGIAGQIEPHIQTVLSQDYLETLSKQFEQLGGLVNRVGGDSSSLGGDVQKNIQTIGSYQNHARAAIAALAASAAAGEVNEGALVTLGGAVHGMVSATGSLGKAVGRGVSAIGSDISAIASQISAISRTFAMATEDAKQALVTDLSDLDLAGVTEGRVLSCINSGSVEADLNVGGITGVMGLESTADPEDNTPDINLAQRRRFELKAIVDSCENTGVVAAKRSYAGGICGRMELGMITQSKGYGRIGSENGDYVGGIAGLAGGTIRDCFAKCTLSGKRYIGGIVGSGIGEDLSGDSSLVTNCCSMVDIPEYEQYVGAIAGIQTGLFLDNYFVSDTLAGINRVSYETMAKPVTYAQMQAMQGVPSALQELRLCFMADGKTVKTLSFRYGASFDDSVFPEIPQKEGCYARWSSRDLQNLRFDTVVEAQYFPYITSLYSQDVRPEDRPMFFVQGQFQEGDDLTVIPGKTDFPLSEQQILLEQWTLSIPADGLESHVIRYLPLQEKAQLYLLKNSGWDRISPEALGTYLSFEAAGAEVELAVVASTAKQMDGRILAAVAAGVLVLLVILIVIVKQNKARKAARLARQAQDSQQEQTPQAAPAKKLKKRWILALTLITLAAGAGTAMLGVVPRTKVVQAVRVYDILNTYLQQPEQVMRLSVKAQMEGKDADFTAGIQRSTLEGTPITVISEGQRKLYYANNSVFLENGSVFRLNAAVPDYAQLTDQLLELYRLVQIDAVNGVYSMTVEGSEATAIAKLLMPSAGHLLPETNRLTVDLMTDNDVLTQIRFTGAGNLADSVKTPFSLSASLNILPVSGPVVIPQAVAEAITSKTASPEDVYSDDLIRLLGAWSHLRDSDALTAQVSVDAVCGILKVKDDFGYTQWTLDQQIIHGIDKAGRTVYLSDGAAYGADGKSVKLKSAEDPDMGALLKLLFETSRNARFQLRQEEDVFVYTVTLNRIGMKQFVQSVLPQAEELSITYGEGSIQLRIEGDRLESIQITCGGSTQVITTETDVQLHMEILFPADAAIPELPEAVRTALVK